MTDIFKELRELRDEWQDYDYGDEKFLALIFPALVRELYVTVIEP